MFAITILLVPRAMAADVVAKQGTTRPRVEPTVVSPAPTSPQVSPLPKVEPMAEVARAADGQTDSPANEVIRLVVATSEERPAPAPVQTVQLAPAPPKRLAQVPEPLPDAPPARASGLRPMNELSVDIAASSGPLPTDRAAALETNPSNPLDYSRTDFPVAFQWESPVFSHCPLYFQDTPTEHYGQTRGRVMQGFYSAGRFACSTIMLPYKMALDPPCRQIYTLRDLPPQGTPVPLMRQTLPIEAGPAVAEAAVLVPILVLIP